MFHLEHIVKPESKNCATVTESVSLRARQMMFNAWLRTLRSLDLPEATAAICGFPAVARDM